MAILARTGGELRQPAPAGRYFGICVGVYDIGTQSSTLFGPKHQVVIVFELHKLRGVVCDSQGQPLQIAVVYNLCFGPQAHLRLDIERILGRTFTEEEAQDGFDVISLLETRARLVVTQFTRKNGSLGDRIELFMPFVPGDPELPPVSPLLVYELDLCRPIPRTIPFWIARKISESHEWMMSTDRHKLLHTNPYLTGAPLAPS